MSAIVQVRKVLGSTWLLEPSKSDGSPVMDDEIDRLVEAINSQHINLSLPYPERSPIKGSVPPESVSGNIIVIVSAS